MLLNRVLKRIVGDWSQTHVPVVAFLATFDDCMIGSIIENTGVLTANGCHDATRKGFHA
jgi:hypothetical protein